MSPGPSSVAVRSNRRCDVSLSDKVGFLKQRRSYPSCPAGVAALETHFAWVFLTPRRAYKLKKPLQLAEMDYRTLAARKRGCLEELRLNRRLAPTVYLALERLSSGAGGRLRLGGHGRTEEYLVKMRRLPGAEMLDQAVRRHRVSRRQLQRLVHRLSQFFAAAPRQRMHAGRYLQRLRHWIRDNRTALRRIAAQLSPALPEEVARRELALLSLIRRELGPRGKRLVEGHGDLRAEHVCLAGAVDVIDCLEFDADLRRLDPAQEAALLALEIELLGDQALAREFLTAFCRATGDSIPESTLQFYISLNAMTRAKLASWHVGDPQFPDPLPWIRRAEQYLLEAQRHIDLALLSLGRDPVSLRAANARAARPAARRAAAATMPAPAEERRAAP